MVASEANEIYKLKCTHKTMYYLQVNSSQATSQALHQFLACNKPVTKIRSLNEIREKHNWQGNHTQYYHTHSTTIKLCLDCTFWKGFVEGKEKEENC